MPFDKTTPWARGLVNLNQTAQERKEKYRLASSLGVKPAHARRMRDWREAKIRRQVGMNQPRT